MAGTNFPMTMQPLAPLFALADFAMPLMWISSLVSTLAMAIPGISILLNPAIWPPARRLPMPFANLLPEVQIQS
jgi:hypothetical protein